MVLLCLNASSSLSSLDIPKNRLDHKTLWWSNCYWYSILHTISFTILDSMDINAPTHTIFFCIICLIMMLLFYFVHIFEINTISLYFTRNRIPYYMISFYFGSYNCILLETNPWILIRCNLWDSIRWARLPRIPFWFSFPFSKPNPSPFWWALLPHVPMDSRFAWGVFNGLISRSVNPFRNSIGIALTKGFLRAYRSGPSFSSFSFNPHTIIHGIHFFVWIVCYVYNFYIIVIFTYI